MDNQPNDTENIITVEEAIELFKTDTRQNPTVDTKYIAQRTAYLRDSILFRIPLLAKTSDGKIVQTKSKFVRVVTSRDAHTLDYAIRDHYKELAHKELEGDIDTVPTKSSDSTVKNDQVGEFKVTKGKKGDMDLKPGDTISTPAEGAKLTVGK